MDHRSNPAERGRGANWARWRKRWLIELMVRELKATPPNDADIRLCRIKRRANGPMS